MTKSEDLLYKFCPNPRKTEDKLDIMKLFFNDKSFTNPSPSAGQSTLILGIIYYVTSTLDNQ